MWALGDGSSEVTMTAETHSILSCTHEMVPLWVSWPGESDPNGVKYLQFLLHHFDITYEHHSSLTRLDNTLMNEVKPLCNIRILS